MTQSADSACPATSAQAQDGRAARSIWLFRHGALVPNPERRFVGQRDVELSAHGRASFEALAARFAEVHADNPPQAFFCSDSSRGIACADMLRRAFRPRGGTMPVIADRGFREISLGAWEGLTKEEVERRFPGALAERDRNWADYAPAGGESFAMLSSRALMALVRARMHCPEGMLVVVGHASFNRCVLADYLALPLCEARRIPQEYGCMACLENR
ncbi:MAG: histidine phosphatase family protein [Desulfovibrionaceae bacterium]|nr:histidine phosphatase family protein [Desulfovibrionaceae bacterium]